MDDDLCTHSEEVGLFMTPFPDLFHELSSHSSDVPAAFRVGRQHLNLMAEIRDSSPAISPVAPQRPHHPIRESSRLPRAPQPFPCPSPQL